MRRARAPRLRCCTPTASYSRRHRRPLPSLLAPKRVDALFRKGALTRGERRPAARIRAAVAGAGGRAAAAVSAMQKSEF